MRRLVLVAATIVMLTGILAAQCGGSRGQMMSHDNGEAAIRAVLDSQVSAWNRGDLEGFMTGYWNSPDLTFFSAGTQTSGWDAALERYRKGYQAPGKEMGTLSFTDLKIVMLAPDAAFVRGRFHLVTTDGKNPEGLFTLVWRKFPEGWRIVHDHSSSAGQ